MAEPTKETLKKRLEQANAEIKKLKAEKTTLQTPHELLDASIKSLEDNEFYMRGVDSKGIASLVRSARNQLRIATKK